MTNQSSGRPPRRAAGIFDVRNIIGALLGIYGIALTIMGLVNFTDTDKAKADGVNLNLWTGLAMIVVAVLMSGWAFLRPIAVTADHDTSTPQQQD